MIKVTTYRPIAPRSSLRSSPAGASGSPTPRRLDDLNPENLSRYDALLIYANINEIKPAQEKALIDYVEGGGAFVPLHCASYCFLNSPKYIALVGAQFLRHGTGTFDTKIVDPSHPIMKGFEPFRTWDETYVHHKHNEQDRHVLQVRAEGQGEEPWTWVRTQGKGRVFYTAYGHDARTWQNPGFQDLVERGIRWAVNKGPVFDSRGRVTSGLPPFAFEESTAEIPNYLPGKQWGTQGEPIHKMQRPLSPEESVRHMVVPRGFEPRLFAAEPQIAKPLCMAWDHRGRLWIAESVDYPNTKHPGTAGRDRITVCEDTNGDGKADSFKVFAEGLNIPTSLLPANGGVIVLQAPDTLFLKDTDGDGKADVRKVLFTGWGTSDTHAGPSNLRWGFDNWVWGIVGYSGFRGTVGGEQHRAGQTFYRFKPDGSKLEFLRNTNNNSWGVGFSEDGLVFGSTANGCPSVYMPIPNRYYEAVRGWSPRVLENIAPNFQFFPVTDQVRQVELARRIHRRGRPCALHRAGLSRSVLELDGLRRRADRAPGRHLHAQSQGERRRRVLRLEPAGQQRRVDGAHRGGGRPRRPRLGHRLVQLHRPAQPHAARLQDRPGERLRDAAPRQDPRADLSDRLQGRPRLPPAGARSRATRRAWSPRSGMTINSGGCTPSGCWSSEGRPTSCRP